MHMYHMYINICIYIYHIYNNESNSMYMDMKYDIYIYVISVNVYMRFHGIL